MARLETQTPPAASGTFIGRETECAAVVRALHTGQSTVVYGRSGLGKTALVLRALSEASLAKSAVFVRLTAFAGAGPETLAQLLFDSPLSERFSRPAAVALEESLLMLAEEAKATIVVDAIDGSAVWAPLLRVIAERTEASRWLFVSAKRPERLGKGFEEVEVGPLSHGELFALATSIVPGLDEERCHALATDAGGSPRILLRSLASPDGGAESDDAPDDHAAHLLGLLHLGDVPTPEHVLGTPPALIARAEARGDAERTEAGLVPLVPAPTAKLPLEEITAFGQRLLSAARSDLFQAGVRVSLVGGAAEAVAAALEERWQRLERSPQLVPLFALVRVRNDPALAGIRYRMAVALGHPMLRDLDVPEDLSFEELMSLGISRLRLGDGVEARKVLDELLRREAPDESQRQAAVLWAAHVAQWQGLLDEARAYLVGLEPVTLELELRHAVMQAHLAPEEDDEGKQRWLRRVMDIVAEGPALHTDVAMEAGRLLYVEIRPEAALEALSLTTQTIGMPWHEGRMTLYFELLCRLELIEVKVAGKLLKRLLPFTTDTTQYHAVLRWANERMRVSSGHGPDTFEALDRMLLEEGEFIRVFADAIASLRLEATWLDARPLDDALGDIGPQSRANADRLLARRGELVVGEPTEPGPSGGTVRALAEVDALLAGGRWDDALQRLESLEQWCRGRGHRLYWIEALEARLVASALAGRLDRDALDRHRLMAEQSGAPRHISDAAFYELCFAGDPPDAGSLLALLRRCASPVARRRLRALLGLDVRRDAIDDRVIASMQARLSWQPLWPSGAPEIVDEATFFDTPTKTVIHHGGMVDLGRRKKLWSLLESLAKSDGGAATKERLVTAVWGEREYHPLRHDNRLHAAVSQLRKALSAVGAAEILVRSDDGYAIGVPYGLALSTER